MFPSLSRIFMKKPHACTCLFGFVVVKLAIIALSTFLVKGLNFANHFFFNISLPTRIPGKTYMIIAFLTVGTMGLSNTSLGYLNYPTQVIFKCCKLIPVMIGGIFIQG